MKIDSAATRSALRSQGQYGLAPTQLHIALRFLVVFVYILIIALAGSALWLVSRPFKCPHRFYKYIGRLIAWSAERTGPSGTKLAQIVSYRQDLLPFDFLLPLTRLQESASPLSRREIKRTLELAQSKQLLKEFSSIDKTPIASGSIAVILRAETSSGHLVAIKLVRRGVKWKLRADVLAMRYVLRLLRAIPRLQGWPILESFDLIATSILDQADMQRELAFLKRMRKMTSRETWIPVPYENLCTSEILVMSYLPARYRICDNDLTTQMYQTACNVLLRDLYRMIFVEGAIHLDLHPGNIGVAEDGRVVLYDFGLCATLSDGDRLAFKDFFLSLVAADADAVAAQLISNAVHVPERVSYPDLVAEVRRVVLVHSRQRAGTFLVCGFVSELFAIEKKFGIFGTPGFVNAVFALAMFEGLVRKRFPLLDFQNVAELLFGNSSSFTRLTS